MKLAKTISILSATAIAFGTAIPAFAEVPEPSAGEQTGTGKTTLKLIVDGTEYGGTESGGNPMAITDPTATGYDADAPGTNLAFTVPTELDFVVKASGDMLCPSETATAIHNLSVYGIHVSSLDVDSPSGWNLVTDANFDSSTAANTVSMNAGPATDSTEKLSLSSYLTQGTIANGLSKWGMSAAGAENNKDKLYLSFDGMAKNLNAGYGELATFASIHWYLTSGGEGIRYVDPADRVTINKTAATNGSFKVTDSASSNNDLSYAAENDRVYIVATPSTGYVTDTMTVTKTSDNTSVTVTRENGSNIGYFTMPDEEVEIGVVFGEMALLDIFPLSTMKADSATLRSSTATNEEKTALVNKYLPYAQAGKTVTVTLANNWTRTVRLVDVAKDRGLVFQFDYTSPIDTTTMNSTDTSVGGWTNTALRTSLNSGAIYTSKLQGMTIAGETIDPAETTLKSLDYNGGSPQVITTTGDKFWLPSVVEIYGTDAWSALDALWYTGGKYTGTEDCTQFAYYATLQPDPTDYLTNPLASGSWWWLRSVHPTDGDYFMLVYKNGSANDYLPTYTGGVVPCFCL